MNTSKTLTSLLIVSGGLSVAIGGATPARAQCGVASYGALVSGFGGAEPVRETPEERAARVAAAQQRREARALAKAERKAARDAAHDTGGSVAIATASCAGG